MSRPAPNAIPWGRCKSPPMRITGADGAGGGELSDLGFAVSNADSSRRLDWSSGRAQVNRELGLIDEQRERLIQQAAQEVIDGQARSISSSSTSSRPAAGTSTNMNANEVIAAPRQRNRDRASVAGRIPIHPNDHVNMEQSSNDVIPTAIHVSAAVAMKEALIPALASAGRSADPKGERIRRHREDRPHASCRMRRRSAWGRNSPDMRSRRSLALMRCEKAIRALRELPLGGTAVGTGINSHPDFAKQAIAVIAQKTGIDFVEAKNHFEAQASKDGVVEASGQLRTIAISLTKIANDIRWLASGPRCGIGEISIPATQPGSVDHAGQGQPGDERDGAAGRRAGDRQRRDDRVRRQRARVEHVRAERDDAGDGVQPASDRSSCSARAAQRVRRSLRRTGSRPIASAAQNWSSRAWRCARAWPR